MPATTVRTTKVPAELVKQGDRIAVYSARRRDPKIVTVTRVLTVGDTVCIWHGTDPAPVRVQLGFKLDAI